MCINSFHPGKFACKCTSGDKPLILCGDGTCSGGALHHSHEMCAAHACPAAASAVPACRIDERGRRDVEKIFKDMKKGCRRQQGGGAVAAAKEKGSGT